MENNKNIVLVVVLALVAGFGGGVFGEFIMPDKEPVLGYDGSKIVEERIYIEESEVIKVIDEVMPAVVNVVVSKDFPIAPDSAPFHDRRYIEGYESLEVGGGTGFIVSADGLVLTNKHVVDDLKASYKVILSNGDEYDVEVLSRDPFDDVAVLKMLEVKDLPVVKLGDSDLLKVGQKVLAIGNALALYGNTVTSGIISAKGREVAAYNDFGVVENLVDLIQTDAAINLGNSGGPLINLNGEVIGMNVAVAEDANSIGFAIPINDLKHVLTSIEKYGEIIRPVLGVRFVTLTNDQIEELGAEIDSGAMIVAGEALSETALVPGGAAEKAGLKEYDVITEVDGIKVSQENPLQKIIRDYNPGDVLSFSVWRDGETMVIEVTLESSKDL
ncbi:trypsin-like peptidase domain-containing protein [Candidatus Peregrinibacteria bacterium]|nr:trypsin-like peptidase domain-containing protein [Candidatus Peregrinibacteria bacterium]